VHRLIDLIFLQRKHLNKSKQKKVKKRKKKKKEDKRLYFEKLSAKQEKMILNSLFAKMNSKQEKYVKNWGLFAKKGHFDKKNSTEGINIIFFWHKGQKKKYFNKYTPK